MKLDPELVKRELANHRLIPETVKLAAYRTIEESMTNTIKHSTATETAIELNYFPDSKLEVTVKDNGQGFDTANIGSGLGLAIIQSYVDITGGKVDIRSTPGKGTEISVAFSLGEHKNKVFEEF
jgi:signal transduction histidine kinase